MSNVNRFSFRISFPILVLLAQPAFCLPARTEAEPAASTPAARVILGEETVFTVNTPLFSLSPEERAQRISQRMKKLAEDTRYDPLRIQVADNESASEIALDDFTIMSVTNNDARTSGLPRKELAARHAGKIKQAIGNYRKTYDLRSLALGGLFALLATLIFVFLWKLAGAGYSLLGGKLTAWAPSAIKSIRIGRVELLPAARITEFLRWSLSGLNLLLLFLLFYIYLSVLFSFFPWTHGLAAKLLGYAVTPLVSLFKALVGYIPDLIFVIITIVCVHYLLKGLEVFAGEVQKERITLPGFYPDWAKPTFQIVRFVVWAFSLVIIFPYLPGSSSSAFRGVSVFLGVLFSLGSTSAVSNAVAGVILTYMRPFKIGDRVKIVDTVGDVIEKGLLLTRIKTIKNVYITIPNALVLSSHIINYSSLSENEGLILNTTVTIGYDVAWAKVHELLIAAADAADGILPTPRPFVLQTALNDCNVAYELNAYTDRPETMSQIYSDIHRNIQDGFAAAGIEILSPAYTAMRDGNEPVLPSEKAETARQFRVTVNRKHL